MGKECQRRPIIVLALAATPFLARGLNALALGEATALHLGIPVQRLKYVAIVSVSAAVGASVAVSGGIGFCRHRRAASAAPAIGPDNRYLLPASALLGAILLAAGRCGRAHHRRAGRVADRHRHRARGAPFFLWILLRNRGVVDL
jgi:iron complex transport system permease protein